MRRVFAILCASVLALAGCGGGDEGGSSEESPSGPVSDSPAGAVETFYEAAAKGDADAACAQLTDANQDTALAHELLSPSGIVTESEGDCQAQVTEDAGGDLKPRPPDRLEITDETDSEATAVAEFGYTHHNEITLVNEGDGWKIDENAFTK